MPVLALLLAQSGEDFPDGLNPGLSEDGGVSALLPVPVGKPERVAVGVYFPLPREDIRV